MLSALLRLPAKKWQDYMKELGFRFPLNEVEYKSIQSQIVREAFLGAEITNLGGLRNLQSHVGARPGQSHYLMSDGPDAA